METTLFASWTELISGLLVGIAFGFFLRKAYVTRFQVIVGQLLLKDFTVMKVMMSAIAFGSLGIYLLAPSSLLIDPAPLTGALVGGGIFGIGMAVMGFCPGTGIGALADGARDMWFGLLGMIVGAGIFAEFSETLTFGQEDQSTLSNVLGVSHWVIIALLFVGVFVLTKIDTKNTTTRAEQQ